MSRLAVATAALSILAAGPAAAQQVVPERDAPSTASSTAPSHAPTSAPGSAVERETPSWFSGVSLSLWTAVKRDTKQATFIGYTRDRDLYMVGLRLVKPLNEEGLLHVDYTADLLPSVRSTQMPVIVEVPAPGEGCSRRRPVTSSSSCLNGRPVEWQSVSGYGIIPLGVQFRLAPQHRVSFSSRWSVGAVRFAHSVPDPRARRFNFTLDAGAGVDVKLPREMKLSTGLRFNHFSNAHTADLNPGMNTLLLEAGVSYAGWPVPPRLAVPASRQASADSAHEARYGLNAGSGSRAVMPRSAITAWSAVARDEPLKTRDGGSHDRDLYITGLRWMRPLHEGGRLRLDYTADVLPAIFSTEMPVYEKVSSSSIPCLPNQLCATPGAPNAWGQRIGAQTVYGVGVVPFGLALRAQAHSRLALVARGSMGAVRFNEPVPDPEERRLNFTLDTGLGTSIALADALALDIGWRLNHISNGGRGRVNPGMNSRMLEIGISRTR